MRRSALQIKNTFTELPVVERLLVLESVGEDHFSVSVNEGNWLEKTSELLAAGRLVTLTCLQTERKELAEALNSLVTTPIESGYLRAYARLQGIRQNHSSIEADIELVEASQ